MHISDKRFLEKVFKAESRRRGTGCSSWTNLQSKFGSLQEHQLRRAQEFDRFHAKIDIGTWSRNSECIYDWLESHPVDKIYAYARSSNRVDENRFRLMRGEDARAFRSEPKMAWSTWRISTVQFLQRIRWNWWLRIYVIGFFFKDFKISARSKHWTWTRTNYLRVKVQWHQLDKERTFRKVYLEFHLHRDGGTFHRNWSPSIQGHQCFESWNSEKKRWQMYDTLQCGFVEHRTLVSQNSLSKSAQYLRSSFKMVWRVRSMDSESERVVCGDFRGKRKWAATEKCEAARSEFLGANSKERESGIWKQIARMCSEIWNTGERNPIYESLCRCDIYEKNLSWDELQNYSWRRWLFWRPNLSLQRIHTASRRSKFQDLRNNSTTNYNWTSSSSSYYTISWYQRIWNSDSFHSNKRFENVGDDNPRQKSLGGRVTSQWFRPQSRKFWITGAYRIGKIYFNEKRTWFTRNAGIVEQRENSCEAVANSVNNLKKLFPLKKGSGMIFLLVIISEGFQRKCFWSRSLEVGYEIGTPLWSRRKGNRRSRSSDLADKGKRTCILRFRTMYGEGVG